ncbi:MAG: hypothetical protein KF721_04440 [Ignavibacteriaceae bacterium]|nr:hypothetical protein [Ignavibacteriaceae bacterium]HRI45515.1 hypothetical protein [Ignavibacteriaceae bacterium]
MSEEFNEPIFTELKYSNRGKRSNLIKADKTEFTGKIKLSCEEDDEDGIKLILRKDEHDNIKEIKFVCSCGQTKTLTLDYTE